MRPGGVDAAGIAHRGHRARVVTAGHRDDGSGAQQERAQSRRGREFEGDADRVLPQVGVGGQQCDEWCTGDFGWKPMLNNSRIVVARFIHRADPAGPAVGAVGSASALGGLCPAGVAGCAGR